MEGGKEGKGDGHQREGERGEREGKGIPDRALGMEEERTKEAPFNLI